MDPGPFIALAFVSPALVAAVGSVWLGAKFFNRWSQKKDNLHEAIERLEAEIGDIHERLDFHEHLLEQHREAERLRGGR
jgi:membrane protein implicated in regulation of membrane protease activity